MSTISKLDPRVRAQRSERRSMITGLQQMPTLNTPGMCLLNQLRRIRHNPRHPGTWKQELFDDTIARFEALRKSMMH